jgi:hypothetical protein
MKQVYLAGLLTGWLALPGASYAQPATLHAATPAAGISFKPVLGGSPQIPRPQAAHPAGPSTTPTNLAWLRQLPTYARATQPGEVPTADTAFSVKELLGIFPQAIRQQPGFVPDVAASARATARPGSPSLLTLALAPSAAGVPGGGAAVGQRLLLRGPAGEVVATVARPAAAGSCTLVVQHVPGLAGQPVFVVGLEHAAVQTIDYELLALLSLRAAQAQAHQLDTVRQELASLRSQLAAARQLNGGLLLDHVELQDLKAQLRHLQAQQAASFSAAHRRPVTGWAAE